MAKLINTALALLIVSVVLVDLGAQARQCFPPCGFSERCVSARPGERRSWRDNVCVPRRCFFRPRRGRCYSSGSRYYFDQATFTCQPLRSGSCYGRRNRFSSLEKCDLACAQWLRL